MKGLDVFYLKKKASKSIIKARFYLDSDNEGKCLNGDDEGQGEVSTWSLNPEVNEMMRVNLPRW